MPLLFSCPTIVIIVIFRKQKFVYMPTGAVGPVKRRQTFKDVHKWVENYPANAYKSLVSGEINAFLKVSERLKESDTW